jgi:hypothetical protein
MTDKVEATPRSIRMTDEEYELFRALGGGDWLRLTMKNMRPTKRSKAKRNVLIRTDAAAGANLTELADKYNVNRVTIWRVCNVKSV